MSTDRPLDVMTCLRRRMPITLLIDLLDPRGPDSREILQRDDPEPPWGQAPNTVLWSTSNSSAR